MSYHGRSMNSTICLATSLTFSQRADAIDCPSSGVNAFTDEICKLYLLSALLSIPGKVPGTGVSGVVPGRAPPGRVGGVGATLSVPGAGGGVAGSPGGTSPGGSSTGRPGRPSGRISRP